MKAAAEFVSEFFSPLLVPLLTFMLILNQSANAQMLPIEKLICFAIAAMFSSGLIFVYVHYLKHKQVIGSTALTDRNQRISPMTFAVLSYGFGFLVLWLGSRSALLRIPDLMLGLMFCYATNTMVLLLITRSWKISVHTAMIAGTMVALTHAYGPKILPFYVLIPIVGFARMTIQGSNTAPQVVAGGFLGLFMTIIQLQLLLGKGV
jgi:hypothetical protein